MNNINNNIASMNSNDNNNTMTSSTIRSIKITFQGASHDVNLPSPVTLARLQAAISSSFSVELPARSSPNEAAKDTDLCFTYKDPEGDDIVFDKDSELDLALRLCPSSLEISAAGQESKQAADKPDPEGKLYKLAARNLREYHGVPSMTPAKLAKTIAFLELNPRRLVKQGLAPKVLLARMNAKTNKEGTKHSLGDDNSNDDIAESVAAGMELMSFEDGKKEWTDGFVSVEPSDSATAPATAAETRVSDMNSIAVDASSPSDNKGKDNDTAVAVKKNLIHQAFVAGGIQLRPREVRPLLLALGVRPHRLAKLGMVDGKDLRAMLEAEKRVGNMRRGVPAGPVGGFLRGPVGVGMRGGSGGARGGSRGRCGPGKGRMGAMVNNSGDKPRGRMILRRRLHPFAGPPPPPPPHMEEDDAGVFFVPANACPPGVGHMGRRGGHRGGPHPRPSHRRHAEGLENGEGGPPGFHRGPPPGLMSVRQARRGGGRQQHCGHY